MPSVTVASTPFTEDTTLSIAITLARELASIHRQKGFPHAKVKDLKA